MKFETQLLQGSSQEDAPYATQPPLYQTVSFAFPDFQTAIDRFEMNAVGATYTRSGNPTVDLLAAQVAKLEGAVGAVATASGHAAQFAALLPLMRVGDHLVGAPQLYGGSTNQFLNVFPQHFGWAATIADDDSVEAYKRAMTERTRAIFVESYANPSGAICDIEALARLAEEYHVPLIVDNTMASPYLCKPFDYGAHLITHSTTKYLTGNGTAVGGAVVDSGQFDWGRDDRYPALTTPCAACSDINLFEKFGKMAYLAYVKAIGVRDLGLCQQPANAYFSLIGMETLALRMQQHVKNAQIVANYLRSHPKVSYVSRPEAGDELVKRYAPKGAGAVFTFDLKSGDRAASGRFIEALKLFHHVVNIGDHRSLIVHPASTTHKQISQAARDAAHISEASLRVSIGIEDADDLIADLEIGFAAL